MAYFDLISAIRSKALLNGWKFIYALDDFETNQLMTRDLGLDEHVLVAGFEDEPTIKNRKITQVSFSGLMLLGRKFDANGQAAMLDETQEQKHDRRLHDLKEKLTNFMAELGCEYQMEVDTGKIIADPDKTDENLDFANAVNVTFVK